MYNLSRLVGDQPPSACHPSQAGAGPILASRRRDTSIRSGLVNWARAANLTSRHQPDAFIEAVRWWAAQRRQALWFWADHETG
jgi:hypothetical protein